MTGRKPLSLRWNILWTGLGSASYYGAQYVVIALISKFGNSVMVGLFGMGQAVTAPVIIFSQMQFRQVQVTDVRREFSFADYLWARTLATIIALFVITAIVFLKSYTPAQGWVVLLIALAKAFDSLSDLAYGNIQKHDRMDLVAISMLAKAAASVIVFAVLLIVTGILYAALMGMVAVYALVFFFYDMRVSRRILEHPEPLKPLRIDAVLGLARISFPLALTSSIVAVLSNLPRYFLEPQYGLKSVGYFTTVSSLLAVLMLVTGSISQATLARAARYFQEGQSRAFLTLAIKVGTLYFTLCLIVTLVFAVGGKSLISILFTPEYAPCSKALVIMAAGMCVGTLASIGSLILSAGRLFKAQFISTLVVLAVQIPLTGILVSKWGVIGAGWSEFGRQITGTVVLLAFVAGYYVQRKRKGLPLCGVEADSKASAS